MDSRVIAPLALALAGCFGGCVGGLDAFTIVEPDGDVIRDGGVGADAALQDGSRGDSGPPDRDAGPDASSACSSVLGCLGTCDSAIGSKFLEEDFDVSPTTLMNLSGSFDVVGGDLVILATGDTRTSLIQSTAAYNNVVACAEIGMPAYRVGAPQHVVGLHLRGPMHGITCYLDAVQNRMVIFSLDEFDNTLVTLERRGWLGDAVELRMLTYLRDGVGHCEVQNLSTGEVVVLAGAYTGLRMSVNATIEGLAADPILVHRLVVGPPSTAARAILP